MESVQGLSLLRRLFRRKFYKERIVRGQAILLCPRT